VLFREQQDREGQEALYQDTLRLLSGGDEQVRGRGKGGAVSKVVAAVAAVAAAAAAAAKGWGGAGGTVSAHTAAAVWWG
jgi:hypothetical protein